MARMFDDTFLVNYSLYGFKQKKSFSNLACYRLIIGKHKLIIYNLNCKYNTVDD